ncbi:unnamed protein product [Brugia pahangi]|uniref:Uncharacterized protein n=1 Tax=Brugia pahangi TaxID=6280 RepID=A0A0N4TD29_BRUPA|nr:unnamed protein product [Brugia pahangi]
MCDILSNRNCTIAPIILNATNYTMESLDNDNLTNETDLIKITSQLDQLKFTNSNNLTLELNANLTDSNLFISSANDTSTLIISSNIEISNLLSELISLQNLTNNNTTELTDISNATDNQTKMITMKSATTDIIHGSNSKLKTNASSVNCFNEIYRLSDMINTDNNKIINTDNNKMINTDNDRMISKKNIENVIYVSEQSSFIQPDLRKLLEIVRDASNALLRTFHITTISDNIALINDNITDNNSSITNNGKFKKFFTFFFQIFTIFFLKLLIFASMIGFIFLKQILGENSTNYHNASAICSEYNASLTSISDFDEMKFISGISFRTINYNFLFSFLSFYF